jgi:hypothetical protein
LSLLVLGSRTPAWPGKSVTLSTLALSTHRAHAAATELSKHLLTPVVAEVSRHRERYGRRKQQYRHARDGNQSDEHPVGPSWWFPDRLGFLFRHFIRSLLGRIIARNRRIHL